MNWTLPIFVAATGGLSGWLIERLQWIHAQGAWGPVLFIGFYAACTVCMVPGSLLTLGAGFVFGILQGSLCVSAASTLGATLAFLLGRSTARRWIAKKLGRFPKFQAVDEAVGREGAKMVLLLRLSPVFPFTWLNYLLSLTKVSAPKYILSSWIGMMPGTIMYVYLGSLLGDLTQAAAGRTKTPAEWAFTVVGILATIAVTVYVTRVAKQAIRRQVAEPSADG